MASVDTPQIGPVIQHHRKQRGLTLEQLASLSGVSKSMLSQIERGQANPTFGVLWNLTRALKIEFTDLLGASGPADKAAIERVSAADTPEIKSADGLCRLRILSPPAMAGDTEWYEVEIEPGASLDSDPHAHGAMEHFTALTAGFEVVSAAASLVLRSGETARYRADVAHRIVNTSSRRARGLLVVLYR